jgi:cellulose synthase operon protein C
MRRFVIVLFLCLATPAQAADRASASSAMRAGLTQFYAGNPRAARVQLLNAIKADPSWALPHAVAGRINLALGDGIAAQSELERALAAGMKEAEISHLLAEAFLLQGDPNRAMAEAQIVPPTKTARAYASRIRARAALAMGDYKRASTEMDAAIALAPKSSLLWSDIARSRLTGGNIAGAVAAAQISTTNNPNNSDALMLMGQLVRGQYGLMAAIPWFQRVLELDPNNLPAMSEMAATFGDAGRNREMLEMTRRMLSIDPGNARAYFLQAVLAARADKVPLARSLIYRINGRMDAVPAMMLLGAVLDLKEGNSESAIDTLQDLVKAQPTNLKARRLLGTAMWRAGDAKSAIAVLQPLARRADADSYTLSVIGRAYEEDGNRGAAATYLDRAAMPVRGEPVPFEMQGNLAALASQNIVDSDNADVAIPRISAMIAGGRNASALVDAQRILSKNPGVPAAHVLVGDALMALNRPADAATAYRDATNIQFSEPNALRFLAALQKSGQDAAALRVLDLFLSQNPRSVPGLLLASDHFMETGQWDRAIELLEGLRTRLGDRDATLLSNLGWAWFSKGDVNRAVTFARDAYAIAPGNPAVANSSGWILYKTGKDKATGVALLQKAVSIAPNHPGLHFQLAQALIGTGQKEAARVHLEKAIGTPGFADRQKAAALLAGL